MEPLPGVTTNPREHQAPSFPSFPVDQTSRQSPGEHFPLLSHFVPSQPSLSISIPFPWKALFDVDFLVFPRCPRPLQTSCCTVRSTPRRTRCSWGFQPLRTLSRTRKPAFCYRRGAAPPAQPLPAQLGRAKHHHSPRYLHPDPVQSIPRASQGIPAHPCLC